VKARAIYKLAIKKMRSDDIDGSMVYQRGPKNLWLMCCSDQHWGGRSKEFVWDETRKVRLSMAEAVFEMMRREGLCKNTDMPIHVLCSPDDPTQAQNVKYRTEPHPQQIPYHLIEKITGNLLFQAKNAKTKKGIFEAAEKIRRLSLVQFEKRGSDFVFEQLMQMMERHIEPNLDVFSAILRRAQAADLLIEGVGEMVAAEYGGYDSRNIGFINLGTGNHFSRTMDSEMIEGPLYAQRLRDLLCGMDEWKNKKLPVIKIFGDKHFFGGVSTSYAVYHMSPAAVYTDAYGERGFPPNNTGVSFLGVPVDGPDSGPIFWRTLPFDVIKDFMEENPRSFDWAEFLPNPV